jgi:hypothetical protein
MPRAAAFSLVRVLCRGEIIALKPRATQVKFT